VRSGLKDRISYGSAMQRQRFIKRMFVQYFLDIQIRVSYDSIGKKEVLVKSIGADGGADISIESAVQTE
jgi:hypothetical protein